MKRSLLFRLKPQHGLKNLPALIMIHHINAVMAFLYRDGYPLALSLSMALGICPRQPHSS